MMEGEMSTMITPVSATAVAEAMAKKDLSWFTQRTERGRSEMFTELVTITPPIAQHILENNCNNRNVRQQAVDQIASDIKARRWHLNGETIIVDREGKLVDGQHRLWAVLLAGSPIQTLMVFGVAPGSQYHVDMGVQRTAFDYIRMKGGKYAPRAAALCRLVLMFEKGLYKTGGRNDSTVTKQEVLELFEKDQTKIEYALGQCEVSSYWRKIGASALPAGYYLLSRVNSTATDWFFEKFFHGKDVESTSPILWLRTKLIELDDTSEKLEATLRYWNAWRRDVKMTKKHLAVVRAWPGIEP